MLLGAGQEAVAGVLRKDLLPKLGGGAFPRRIRFVRAMPADGRGKRTARAVKAGLEAFCREPVVTGWEAGGGELRADMVFPGEMECFDGHFDGFPVLPGVAQLYFLRHFARQAFGGYPDAAVYRKLKFQRLIRPGQRVGMRVERLGDGVFGFAMENEEGTCASGRVEAVR